MAMPRDAFPKESFGSAKTIELVIVKMFFAYILKSEVDGSHYYGHSKEVNLRLKRHNRGAVRSTKSKRPWEIHYIESFPTRSEAYRRELYFKSIDGYNFLKSKGII